MLSFKKVILPIIPIVILLALITEVYGATLEARAVVRDRKGRAKEKTVVLAGLTNTTAFEGPDFRIVTGRGNEVLKTDCMDEKLCLKAATVWYHLTKAKKYFIEERQSDYVRELGQLTIRLDIKAKFNAIGHFGNPNLPEEYNNALSIPSGEARPQYGIDAWEKEIWFRPGKEVKMDVDSNGAALSIKMMLKEFRKQMRVVSFQKFLIEMFSLVGNFNGQTMLESSLRFGGSLAILEMAYGGFNLFTRLFRKTKIYLDTALVPEIIYHEFAHVALSDHLELSHSTAVNEGMADYFATRIGNNPKIAKKIGKYAKIKGKDAGNDLTYNVVFETGHYANTDFVLALLYEAGNVVGGQQDDFMYALRQKVNTNSTVRTDLIRNILDLCEGQCEAPRVQKLQLLRMFHDKGL